MADTARSPGVTRQIPRNQWRAYLDRFTREHLRSDPPEIVTVEVLSSGVGDQYQSRGERLMGLTYDDKNALIEVLLENVDHLVYRPVELWVIEEPDGFISTMELQRADGTKELVHIQRGEASSTMGDAAAPP